MKILRFFRGVFARRQSFVPVFTQQAAYLLQAAEPYAR